MTTATAHSTVVWSSGKARKGTGKFNWDYFCQMEYPAGSRIRGIYAVADGSPSPSRGDLASELAIETLKEHFQHYRNAHADGPSESSNLLKNCFEEINATLMKHRIARKEGEEEVYPMYTSLTAGYQIADTFHIGHAGAGVVYLISEGKIRRLSEKRSSDVPEEAPKEHSELVRPSVLGWHEKDYQADFFSIPIEGSTVLIFCTDGVTAHFSSIALLEFWLETHSPDGMVERVTRALEAKGAGEDASIVVFQAESQMDDSAVFVNPIRYPAHVMFKKYLIVLSLLTILGAAMMFRETIVGRIMPDRTIPELVEKLRVPEPAQQTSTGNNSEAEFEFTLEIDPADSLLSVNGKPVEGSSPHKLLLKNNAKTNLRVERAGYLPTETTIDTSTAAYKKLSITLKKEPEVSGTLKIFCDAMCTGIEIDGDYVKTSFPRNFLQYADIKPGSHKVKAYSGSNSQTKTIRIGRGKTAELRFSFPGTQALALAENETEKKKEETGRDKNTGEAVVEINEKIKSSPPAKISSPTVQKPDRVFFMVNTDVPGCSLMIFQNNQLILTGNSGERLDLPPGEYVIEASKEGLRPITKTVYLKEKYQIIELRLK